ncbi:hypothetical protein AB205_0150710 [Aquarana catesbeiana]|uniref:C2H2-type domain-containing protein n=1 Tax=Aquarana catesbeiana TaxID=8400 RepID=A0A2G9R5D6_AQUCT|nr:hypothetical protein AB205_0150710 [Aquarana catesbeiana]
MFRLSYGKCGKNNHQRVCEKCVKVRLADNRWWTPELQPSSLGSTVPPAVWEMFHSERYTVLVKHQRIHISERLYSCSECGKCFTQTRLLSGCQRIYKGQQR